MTTVSCEKIINENKNDISLIFEKIENLDYALQAQRVVSDEMRKDLILMEERQINYKNIFDNLISKINEQNEKLNKLNIIIEHNGKIIDGMMISEKEVNIKLKIFEKYEKLYWLLFSFIFTAVGAFVAFLVKNLNLFK